MNIIVVDDNEFALTSLSRAIGEALPEGRQNCFSDPDEALRFAADEKPDIAFLDVEMGEMNGLELSKRLKEIHNTIQIVFVTGYSEYAADAFKLHAGGYLLKPVDAAAVLDAVAYLNIPPQDTGRLRVQAFGNFEVFADNRPLKFPRSKAKELFAYLIHKRGSGCTLREIAMTLFSDREGELQPLLKQAQNVITAMMQTLKAANFEDVVIKNFNSISVNTERIDCDYYRFLSGDRVAVNAYMGEYMASYDWAEFMTGYLENLHKNSMR